ncbi:anti-sigma factor [Hymenobacter sp. BT186]|uniref:Anti-sigma factor n=1 Tax=Hymenobacter telluris TaxID=2816474 RepID=A0A939F048_9BACT|nr:anti-sigma factor [Hymenobacter telluris]MBO0360317.1 anti-sigma factor [Hymenobacter telluris]MBW3376344.1 hypothetical protein [Hymenobacter norwichensis]
MSQTPELPDQGHQNLRRALNELPSHEPAPATWVRIEAQLAADHAIHRTLPHLPTHTPDDALWAAIAGRLDAAEPPIETSAPEAAPPAVVRTMWPVARPLRLVAGIAAAILVCVLVWWQRPVTEAPTIAHQETSAPHETITYSEETVEAPAATLPIQSAIDPLGQEGVAFIDAHCTSLPTVCQSGEFKELRTQLTELETEEIRLQQATRRFGATPELVRNQVRVTTLKASVTRELIQLLIS